jgi:prepilin-type N-terminal cleavage/methylation domain-containing protein
MIIINRKEGGKKKMGYFIRSKKGFTLVEIMIVVAIIALLAAIAIPGFLRARHNANETAAIGAVRTLSTAMESFRASGVNTTGTAMSLTGPTYPGNLRVLSTMQPPYAPASLTNAQSAAAARQGYFYTYQFVNANQYRLQALPAAVRTTGSRYFYVDETGIIRQNLLAPAGATSAEIQ